MGNIERFIENFKKGYYEEALINAFMNGNCYHFALILKGLFPNDGHIMYDPIKGHFLFWANEDNVYYDIRGIVVVENKSSLIVWEGYISKDYAHYHNVVFNSIYKDEEGYIKWKRNVGSNCKND